MCILTSVKSDEGSCSKKYQDHIPCSFAFKFVSVDDKFSRPIVLLNLLKQFLKSMNTVKK